MKPSESQFSASTIRTTKGPVTTIHALGQGHVNVVGKNGHGAPRYHPETWGFPATKGVSQEFDGPKGGPSNLGAKDEYDTYQEFRERNN